MAKRQTTCFSEDESRFIRSEITRRAINHNRLIVAPVMAKLDLETALQTFIRPEDRELALIAKKRYHNHLSNNAYRVAFRGNIPKINSDAWVVFWWSNDEAIADPDCFVVPANYSSPMALDEMQITPFTSEFLHMLDEWMANAIAWGLVLDVFYWLDNSHCKPRDHAHALHVLPGLLPVIKSISAPLAARLQELKPPRNPPVIPADMIEGVQAANKLLVGSFLLPEADGTKHTPVYMRVTDVTTVKVPGWPDSFMPIVGH